MPGIFWVFPGTLGMPGYPRLCPGTTVMSGRDSFETVQQQSSTGPKTVKRQSGHRPETVQRQLRDSPETVQRQSRDSPVTALRQPWDINPPSSVSIFKGQSNCHQCDNQTKQINQAIIELLQILGWLVWIGKYLVFHSWFLYSICRLRPLDAVLSCGLCEKGGFLPPLTVLTVQRIICC